MAIRVMHIFPEMGIGGTERVILQISKYLLKKDKYEIAICTSNGPREKSFIESGIDIYKIQHFKNKKRIFSNILNIYKSFSEFNPNLVHTHSLYGLLLTFIIKTIFNRNLRIIHTGHGGPRKNYDEIATRLLFMTDIYITISSISYNFLVSKNKKNKSKIILVENGVDFPKSDEYYHKSESNDNFIKLAYIGRLTKQKGLNILFDCLSVLKEKGVSFIFTIVGDGEEWVELEKRARELHIENNIKFLGYDPYPWRRISSSQIVIMPSLWEPGGLVALEAIVRDHTILASNVGGIKERIIHGENGYLFNVDSPNEIVTLILKLINSEINYIYLSDTQKQNYYFDYSAGPMIENIYQNVIRNES